MSYTRAEIRTVMLACCVAGFITPLLSTMLNLSLVSIGKEFLIGSHDLAYVNTSFLLASAIFLVPLSKMGDIIGKKRTFVLGIVVIAAACLLAAMSPSFWFLVVCRAVMGAGAAAVTCTSMSMITDTVPRERRGAAIGVQTMCVYIGLAIGPAVGGLLNDFLGWHSLFLVILPMSVASVAIMMTFRHEIRPDEGSRFDSKGSVLYALAIFLTMFGAVNMPAAWSFAAIAVGVVFLVLFVRQQLSCAECILDMRLFRNRVFSGSCLAAFLNYASSYSISFFMALYLQSIGELTATEAGMLMLVQPAIQAVGTPLFGKISDKVPNKSLLPTAGMLICAASVATLMFYDLDLNMPLVFVTMIVGGFGFSMFSAPNTSVIMSSVRPSETGEASAMVSVMRQTGMMVSMGVAMVVISLIMGSTDNLAPATYPLFIDVMRTSFAICLAMCLIGAVASALRGSGRPSEDRAPKDA